MTKILNAAIIGLGVGEKHIEGYNAHSSCHVTDICDLSQAKLSEVSARNPSCRTHTDPSDILNNPEIDIVSIASFDNHHANQIIQALDNGKHVFAEKPICLTEEELEKIVAALKRNPSLSFGSNLILRKTPRFLELKRLVDSGALGDIYHLSGSYDYGRLQKIHSGWRSEIPFYSVFHGGGIHLLDMAMWVTGYKPSKVFAVGNNISSHQTAFKGPDTISALMENVGGSTFSITSNYASVTPHHHTLSAYGTRGTFEQTHRGAAYMFSRSPDAKVTEDTSVYPGANKGDILPSFIDSVLTDSLPDITAQEVVDVMAVSISVEASLRANSPVCVNYYPLT